MLGGERKVNKISKRNYSIDVRTVSYLRRYCSGVPKLLAFNTPHEGLFFMFGVPNAKYLAFGTIDENALKTYFSLYRLLLLVSLSYSTPICLY